METAMSDTPQAAKASIPPTRVHTMRRLRVVAVVGSIFVAGPPTAAARPPAGAAALHHAVALPAGLARTLRHGPGAPPQTSSRQAELTATGGAALDLFGWSVALSGDTALIGAWGTNNGLGAAYVLVRRGTTWTRQATLTTADGAQGDQFGISVALSGDTALIGAGDQNNNGIEAAYVFVRRGTTWIRQAELTAAADGFGLSVALSGDTALIGASRKNYQTGAAYVFGRHGTTWTRQATLTAAHGAQGDGFGVSVALSGDTALIGAESANHDRGAAYAFARHGTTWTRQATLTAAHGGQEDHFGASVALSGDTALIGAENANNGLGAAYMFGRRGTTWTQQATLTAAHGAQGDGFGVSVALSGDTALIGAYGTNHNIGAAYVFGRRGSTWARQVTLTAAHGARDDVFGISVALGGSTAVIGAPVNLFANTKIRSGAAYVFGQNGTTWTRQARLAAADGTSGEHFGTSMALSGTTALIGALGKTNNTGAAYVFGRRGTTWSRQVELTAADR
jgi:hypothetical protein